MSGNFIIQLCLFFLRGLERRARAHEGGKHTEIVAGLKSAISCLDSVQTNEALQHIVVQNQDLSL